MEIEKRMFDNSLIIALKGRLDTNSAPKLEEEIKDLKDVEKIVFDFQKLEYISSSGLRIILVLQKEMNKKGTLLIKNVSDNIKEVFDVTGFSQILTIE